MLKHNLDAYVTGAFRVYVFESMPQIGDHLATLANDFIKAFAVIGMYILSRHQYPFITLIVLFDRHPNGSSVSGPRNFQFTESNHRGHVVRRRCDGDDSSIL